MNSAPNKLFCITFDIQLSMNDVAHDRSVVQMLDSVLGSPGAGEQYPGQAQVLPGLWMKQDLHLLHLSKLGAHVRQEGLLDVVIESCKGHLFERYGAHIKFIKLQRGMLQREILVISRDEAYGCVPDKGRPAVLTLNLGTGSDSSVYLDHSLRGLGSCGSPTGRNPESWKSQTGWTSIKSVNRHKN